MYKKFEFHFALGFLLRLIFTLYGLYHDRYAEQANMRASGVNRTEGGTKDNLVIPKYTDIDYQVFTDAAEYMTKGESPYQRDTYRYTPLLAFFLQPNLLWNESFGKLIFITLDMVCGYLIMKINNANKSTAANGKLLALCFWFYNPITIAISSRGNAESIMSTLVLAFIYFFKREQYLVAGALYALSIHFKIYPLAYGLILLVVFVRSSLVNAKNQYLDLNATNIFRNLTKIIFNANLIKFSIAALVVILSSTVYFYFKYGYIFLFETYIYHLGRQDIRHNFSPYFYMLYLSESESSMTTQFPWLQIVLKFYNFFVQAFLISCISIWYWNHFELALLMITFIFVTFNKVCTSQYFVWYLCLIPVVLPRLKVTLRGSLLHIALWFIGQAIWLYFGYELEFNGNNSFFQLWIAGLVFASINCYIIKAAFLDQYDAKQPSLFFNQITGKKSKKTD